MLLQLPCKLAALNPGVRSAYVRVCLVERKTSISRINLCDNVALLDN